MIYSFSRGNWFLDNHTSVIRIEDGWFNTRMFKLIDASTNTLYMYNVYAEEGIHHLCNDEECVSFIVPVPSRHRNDLSVLFIVLVAIILFLFILVYLVRRALR